jgi:hypothetical protein
MGLREEIDELVVLLVGWLVGYRAFVSLISSANSRGG